MENTAAFWQMKIFDKSMREKRRFLQIKHLFGVATGDMRCLVAGGSPALHAHIHQLTGNWVSAAVSPEEHQALTNVVGESVVTIENFKFSEKLGQFDRIILINILEAAPDDYAFMAECHKALRDSGILLLSSNHRKKFALLPFMRKLLDITPSSIRAKRSGYSSSELFDILKDGYDVEEMHTFSRFFTETAHLLITFIGSFVVHERAPIDNEEMRLAAFYQRIYRYLAAVYPIDWLICKLDLLFFMTKGYLLTARAKKRMWRPRKTPKLLDGRSIAEATLGGKIGTALEY